MKIQTILPLALASLVFGCGGQLSSDEAGLLDAVAFVTGGQEEGAIPQGFETRWRRTVRERKIEYQSIGPNVGFGQANDPHRDSRQVRIGVNIASPTKCVFKTVVTTEYSKGAGERFDDATSEVATLDFNKVRRFDIEDGGSPQCGDRGLGLDVQAGRMSRYRQDWNFGTPTARGARDREQAAGHRLHQEGLPASLLGRPELILVPA